MAVRVRKARSKEEAKAVLKSIDIPEFDPDESNLNMLGQALLFEYKENGKIKLEIAYRPQRHYRNGVFEIFLNNAQSSNKDFKFSGENAFKTTFQMAKAWALQQIDKL